MAADAYSGVVTIKGVRVDPKTRQLVYTGQVAQLPFTADDVAGNRLTFPQTAETNFRPAFDCVIDDIMATEDGADTSRLELYVDGKQTEYNYALGQLLSTVPRDPARVRAPIPANRLVQFYQRA